MEIGLEDHTILHRDSGLLGSLNTLENKVRGFLYGMCKGPLFGCISSQDGSENVSRTRSGSACRGR